MPQTASLYNIWFMSCNRSKFGDTNKKKTKKKYSYLRKNDPACLSKVREFRTLRVRNCASGPSARSRTLTLNSNSEIHKIEPYVNVKYFF